jgi:hypothetical protein
LYPQPEGSSFRLRTFALRRMWGVGFGAVLLGVLGLGASRTQAERQPGWLQSYRVPSACPSASSFRQQVEQRLARVLDALGRARVSVAISRDDSSGAGPARWRSELTIGEQAEPATSTEVADASCAALVQALALMVALHVDATPAATTTSLEPALADAREPAQPIDRHASALASAASPKQLRFGAAVLGSVRSALGPDPALGFGVGVTLQWAQAGVWAPWLEVSASHLATGEVARPGGTAMRFDALLADARLCPLRAIGTEALWLRPCIDLEAGQLTGRGSGNGLVRAEQRRTPWLTPGASLRAAVIPLGGPLQLSAAFGASFPLFRHEFYFAPNIEGFSVPRVGWNSSGQAAWLF